MAILEHPETYSDRTRRGSASPTTGWHPDPLGHHKLRYHDGAAWTDHVTHYGPTPCSGCADDLI